ncbi:MAG: hypothetical protein P8I34_04305 [Flavobacteriaceae bacterium]|jgi:hypothetical protein|nr:hypothetical protein [Flavobacteriaceae bacterium]MDG1965839.1 hypothetical protein [Flavobacteriaceae bacterium]
MKYFLRLLFLLIMTSLITGLYVNNTGDTLLGNKIIGFTVLTAAFVFMPIFLVHRWKGKNLKDYTLSKENLDKLRDLD